MLLLLSLRSVQRSNVFEQLLTDSYHFSHKRSNVPNFWLHHLTVWQKLQLLFLGVHPSCLLWRLSMLLSIITVFENHGKSLNLHCERSELCLHFEWIKVQWKLQKIVNFGFFFVKLQLVVTQCYQTQTGQNSRKFWVMFKQRAMVENHFFSFYNLFWVSKKISYTKYFSFLFDF